MHARNKGRLELACCLALAAGCAEQSELDSPETTHAGRSAVGGSHAGAGAPNGGAQAGTAPLSAGTAGAAGLAASQAGGAGQPSAGGQPSDGGSPTSGGNQPVGGNTAAGTASGGAAGASACPAPPTALGTTPLIDDFSHLGRDIPTSEGRSGVWDVWTLTAAASMSPKSAMYQTTGADAGNGYTHWTGTSIGGLNDWGPTLTVQLNAGCPYDASVYSGISVKLKGTATKGAGTTLPLKVMLWQPQGVPAKDAKGGTCTAAACYNHFYTFVNVPSSWDAPVSVPFATLTQGAWTGTMPFTWSAKQLVAIQFQVEVDGSKSELTTFDLSLDDLTFVKSL